MFSGVFGVLVHGLVFGCPIRAPGCCEGHTCRRVQLRQPSGLRPSRRAQRPGPLPCELTGAGFRRRRGPSSRRSCRQFRGLYPLSHTLKIARRLSTSTAGKCRASSTAKLRSSIATTPYRLRLCSVLPRLPRTCLPNSHHSETAVSDLTEPNIGSPQMPCHTEEKVREEKTHRRLAHTSTPRATVTTMRT